MFRFLIVVIVYALAVIGLPRWEPFGDLMTYLLRLPPSLALKINAGAIIVAGGLVYLLNKNATRLLRKAPAGLLEIARMGLIGVLFAGIFDLFQGLSGYSMVVENLAIIPLAFIVAETVYVLARWIWQRATNKGSPPARTAVKTEAIGEDEENSEFGIFRLFITVPIYAFVILFLPRQEDFRRLEAELVNVPPNIAAILSGLALLLAIGGGLYTLKRAHSTPLITSDDPIADAKTANYADVKLRVQLNLWIGLAFAGIINLVGFALSSPASVTLLILIPIGTFLAELIYQMVVWRLKYGPPEI